MIRWTTREWELLARRLKSHHVEPQHHGWRTAVVEAMRFCLPAERWRAPHSLNESKKILGPIMRRLAIADQSKEKEAPPQFPLDKYATDELLVELINRLTKTLLEELRTEISAQVRLLTAPQFVVAPRFKHDPLPDCEPLKRKPKVLVVGPINGQQKKLLDIFGDRLDLRFVSSGEGAAMVLKLGDGAELAVLWTNFMSHAHQEAAVKAVGRENVRFATGGLDAVAKLLSQQRFSFD